ncbi:hypothetical protein BST61_g202 [Cercospora zeina]
MAVLTSSAIPSGIGLTNASYDASVFESIPSLEVAHASVTSNSHFEAFLSEFAAIAAASAQNDVFGATLVHRHTRLDQGKRMLDLKQTLQPVPMADSAQDLHGCPIRPKSYALIEGVWKPYEYELGKPRRVEDSQVHFFDRIKQRIVDLDMENIGLRRYSPTDPEELEITDREGISIKVPLDLASYPGQRKVWQQDNFLGISIG